MSSKPVFHPRFSVRSAFDDGVSDAREGHYATQKGIELQNAPRSRKCYGANERTEVMQANSAVPNPQIMEGRLRQRLKQVPNQRGAVQEVAPAVVQEDALASDRLYDPHAIGNRLRERMAQYQQSQQGQVAVERARMDRTRHDPTKQDRDYWRSKQVVSQDQHPGNNGRGRGRGRRPPQQVQGVRWQVEPYVPRGKEVQALEQESTAQDRQYWMSNEVATDAGLVQEGIGYVSVQIPRDSRQKVNEMNRQQLIRMGEREAQLQKEKRGRQQLVLNGMNIDLPAEAFDSGEFTLVLPEGADVPDQFEVQTNPLPGRLALDTSADLRNHQIGDDEDAAQNRAYWGGKTSVSLPKPRSFAPKNE